MDLVDDQDVARESKEPKRLVPEAEDSHQSLVNGADPDLGKQAFLPVVGEPGPAVGGGRSLIVRVLLRAVA